MENVAASVAQQVAPRALVVRAELHAGVVRIAHRRVGVHARFRTEPSHATHQVHERRTDRAVPLLYGIILHVGVIQHMYRFMEVAPIGGRAWA